MTENSSPPDPSGGPRTDEVVPEFDPKTGVRTHSKISPSALDTLTSCAMFESREDDEDAWEFFLSDEGDIIEAVVADPMSPSAAGTRCHEAMEKGDPSFLMTDFEHLKYRRACEMMESRGLPLPPFHPDDGWKKTQFLHSVTNEKVDAHWRTTESGKHEMVFLESAFRYPEMPGFKGHGDYVHIAMDPKDTTMKIHVVDYKFGRLLVTPVYKNPQIITYAGGFLHLYNKNWRTDPLLRVDIVGMIVHPHTNTYDYHSWSFQEFQKEYADVLERVRKIKTRQEQEQATANSWEVCSRCAKLGSCPAAAALSIHAMADLEIDTGRKVRAIFMKDPKLEDITLEERAILQAFASYVEKWGAAVRKVNALTFGEAGETDPPPGFSFTSPDPVTEISQLATQVTRALAHPDLSPWLSIEGALEVFCPDKLPVEKFTQWIKQNAPTFFGPLEEKVASEHLAELASTGKKLRKNQNVRKPTPKQYRDYFVEILQIPTDDTREVQRDPFFVRGRKISVEEILQGIHIPIPEIPEIPESEGEGVDAPAS